MTLSRTVLVLLTTAAAGQESSVVILRRAWDHYENLEIQEAIAVAQRLGDLDKLPDQERQSAYHLLGNVYAVLDNEKGAIHYFQMLLWLSPEFALLPNTARKIQSSFAKAQALLESERPHVALTFVPPSPEPQGLSFSTQVTGDQEQVTTVQLFLRTEGASEFIAEKMTRAPGGVFGFSYPSAERPGVAVHYYFVALDKDGVALARLGTAKEPYRTTTPDQRALEELLQRALKNQPPPQVVTLDLTRGTLLRWTLALTSAAAIAAGSVLWWLAADQRQAFVDAPTYAAQRAALQGGTRYQTQAVVASGIGAALSSATLVYWLVDDGG